jgi:hypothetical protein
MTACVKRGCVAHHNDPPQFLVLELRRVGVEICGEAGIELRSLGPDCDEALGTRPSGTAHEDA